MLKRKHISILCLAIFLGASPALAGQRVCADPPAESRTVLELPARMDNFLYVKGDPEGRFLIRFESTCRKGHIYREVGSETEKIPLGSCFQPSKMHVTARKGCIIVEIDSQKSSSRRR